MRKLALFVVLSVSVIVMLSLRKGGETAVRRTDLTAIGCAPAADLSPLQPDEQGKFAPVFPGWGRYSYKVHTSSDSAQFYFDQGLNLYYSYHLTEALASFKEAARFDTSCTMAYWGQALSMGPYYNGYYYKMPPAVLPVVEQMKLHAALSSSEKEKALVAVMGRRYSTDTSDRHREGLNADYTAGMMKLMQAYPDDADIKALYVDAVMLEHTWNFWTTDGQPRPWTQELVDICNAILKFHPTHPAALHYKIHVVEASHHPEQALAAADSLQATLPGVPHMVHMSSHMYQRNGLYSKGIDVNEKASRLAVLYDTTARNLKLGLFAQTHFDAVETYCALNANMYDKAIQTSWHLRKILLNSYKSRLSNHFFQYLYMMPMLTYVRCGKWKVAMDEPAPDSSWRYASLLYEFGKGMACLRLHRMDDAEQHLKQLRVWLKDSSLTVRIMPFNAPVAGGKIAEAILAGEICFAKKEYKKAIQWLETGVAVEDGMIYREPKDWPIPVRHYLGARLLDLKKAGEAEKVYREDLKHNPGNGWSLVGLGKSIVTQPKGDGRRMDEGYNNLAGAMEAFGKSGVQPSSSVY